MNPETEGRDSNSGNSQPYLRLCDSVTVPTISAKYIEVTFSYQKQKEHATLQLIQAICNVKST